MSDDSTTRRLEALIARLNAGDDSARWELLERAYERLRGLSGKILGDFPRVREDGVWRTTDVALEIRMRLSQALKEVSLADPQHFFRLAAKRINYLLIDLVRRLPSHEPEPQESQPPGRAAVSRRAYQDATARILELFAGLPEEQQDILELESSFGFETAEIAVALGVDGSTVRRQRRRAYDTLHEILSGEFPWLLERLASGQ